MILAGIIIGIICCCADIIGISIAFLAIGIDCLIDKFIHLISNIKYRLLLITILLICLILYIL